jgi:hypothetical protein
MEILLIIMARTVIQEMLKHTEIIHIITITGEIIARLHGMEIKFILTAIRKHYS